MATIEVKSLLLDVVGEHWISFDSLVDHFHFLDDEMESFREVVIVDVD